MLEEFARADIVLMPATAEYKSPNRAVEAIRQGCFVVSERDLGIPHIYVGNILEGIKWTQTQDMNTLISKAQKFVTDEFTPRILIDKWKTLTKLRTTSDAVTKKWDGWINVDLHSDISDIKCDLRKLEIASDSADAVAAIHVLEHFYEWEVADLLDRVETSPKARR
jgi:hypothetical protein